MKRLLLLSVMFCIGVLQGFAQTFTYTDENGVNWECCFSNGMNMPDGSWKDTTYVYINGASNYGEEVTVPGVVKHEGKEYTITQLGSVFSNNQTLKKVTLPKSVTSLDYTFKGCTLLSEIVNTEQIKICGGSTFSGCSSLKNIDLSNCETIGGSTFSNCNNLQSVNLKKCITIESQAFLNCNNLKSVGSLSSCTTIGENAFGLCRSLESIIIPNGVETIEMSAFESCDNLRKISFPPSLKTINRFAFRYCI